MKRVPVKTPKINTIKYYREALALCITYSQLSQEKIVPDKEGLEAVITTAKCALNKEPLYYEVVED